MANFDEIGGQRIIGETSPVAEGAVERGRAVSLGDDRRVKAWTVGDSVWGVSLTSAADGQRLRIAAPGSTMPVANGLMPGDSVAPNDPVAVLGDGSFGLSDPDNDLPAAGLVVDPADENSETLLVRLDGSIATGAGMATKTQFASGDLNGGVLTSDEGVIWSRYAAQKELVRLSTPADLFAHSLAAGDTSVQLFVRLVKGSGAAIPYDEIHLIVTTDAGDGTTLVNLNTGTVVYAAGATTSVPAIGVIDAAAEKPLDVNGFSVQHATTSAGPYEIVDAGAANVIWDIPSVGGVTRSGAQVAALTIPGGWRGLGLTHVTAGSFKESEIAFHVQAPGGFRADATRFHVSVLASVDFIPFFPPGSATSGTGFYPEGTRIEARGLTEGSGADEKMGLFFGVKLERVPD